jgi:hypothetical protein
MGAGRVPRRSGGPERRRAAEATHVEDDAMDPDTICPPWWPRFVWDLHFWKIPRPGPGPVNYPPAVHDMMASLSIHTLTYLMMDQDAAQEIRNLAERRMVQTAQNLSRYHDARPSEQILLGEPGPAVPGLDEAMRGRS